MNTEFSCKFSIQGLTPKGMKKATQDLNEGEVVKILCDSEPSVTKEIPNFCQKKGLLMDSIRIEDKGYWEVYIMKPSK